MMLRWMWGETNKENIRNEHVVKVARVVMKITVKRLQWYDHVRRREEGHMRHHFVGYPYMNKPITCHAILRGSRKVGSDCLNPHPL